MMMSFDTLAKQGSMQKHHAAAAKWFVELPRDAPERTRIAMLCGAAMPPPSRKDIKHFDMLRLACTDDAQCFHAPESIQAGVLREALNIVWRVMGKGENIDGKK